MPTMRSRVDCGFSLTIASFSPMMRLRSVDFPALGLPTTVTIPARGMGGVIESGRMRTRTGPYAQAYGPVLMRCRRRPTLPRPLGRSTIGAVGLNDRVRDGNGCGPYALVASEFWWFGCQIVPG